MKNLLFKLGAALLLSAFLAGSAFAQARIATIDMNKTFNGYWKKKEAEATLKDQETDMLKELKGMEDEYKKIKEAYQKLIDSASDPAVSGEEKDKRKAQADEKFKQLKQKEDEYTAYKNRAALDLQEKKKSVISKIIAEIRSIVAARAKNGSFALVIDSANEAGGVVYVTPENDLTQDVIKDLNANAPNKDAADDTQSEKKKK